MKKDRKKNRLEMFLYKEGYFFVTINVQNHVSAFGQVIEDEMKLNRYGKIVEECWLRLAQQYNYISLMDFVIMPNHVHAIIDIDRDIVGNGRDRSLQPKRKNLSSLVGAFKTISSKKLHEAGLQSFKRQKSFYDHVIRNEQDLLRIQEYIQLNPYKRKNDEYYR
ncbi:MAG: hypothetical protein NTY80_01530 [candidate division SR1 bacterium]|nr:hypothetical protein [candidate division SR1 bacterium]